MFLIGVVNLVVIGVAGEVAGVAFVGSVGGRGSKDVGCGAVLRFQPSCHYT